MCVSVQNVCVCVSSHACVCTCAQSLVYEIYMRPVSVNDLKCAGMFSTKSCNDFSHTVEAGSYPPLHVIHHYLGSITEGGTSMSL